MRQGTADNLSNSREQEQQVGLKHGNGSRNGWMLTPCLRRCFPLPLLTC
jgi:hypothetical protein